MTSFSVKDILNLSESAARASRTESTPELSVNFEKCGDDNRSTEACGVASNHTQKSSYTSKRSLDFVSLIEMNHTSSVGALWPVIRRATRT